MKKKFKNEKEKNEIIKALKKKGINAFIIHEITNTNKGYITN